MLKDETEGVRIAGLSPHGAALTAGIMEKDIILALDGAPVTSVEDIKIHLLYKKKGDRLTVRLKRARPVLADQELDLEMTL
jgi:S1-C subfamily serine protease